MHNTSTTVPPFYDQEQPGASPVFSPMLTDQIKLCTHRPTTLISDEIIVSVVRAPPALAPDLKIAKWSRKLSDCSSSSYPNKVARTHSRSVTHSIHSNSEGSSNCSFDSYSSTSITAPSKNSKIPKPLGHPGRSGTGGYALYDVLNWSPKEYTKFKVRNVHACS
jgi:hypothetical protein